MEGKVKGKIALIPVHYKKKTKPPSYVPDTLTLTEEMMQEGWVPDTQHLLNRCLLND